MKWRIVKILEGLIWGGNSSLGYRLKDKKLHIVQDEAETVRLIYKLYLDGTQMKLCNILTIMA